MGQAQTETREIPVKITENAARRVAELIEKQGNPDLMLRIAVEGGGCSGFQYGFSFAEEAEPGDLELERDGVKVLVDSASLLYLAGSEVDFVEDIVGSSFRITNPNATASCGCGTSFAV